MDEKSPQSVTSESETEFIDSESDGSVGLDANQIGSEGEEENRDEYNNEKGKKSESEVGNVSENEIKKLTNVEQLNKKKIGPQKQKKTIHTILKKSKMYEIRKLTRRISMLRNLKGTEQQKAKNERKVDKILKEIEAMKDFMINTLTDRTVDIFKGKSEKIYLDIWTACQEQKAVENMLQTLSNGNEADKYSKIAYLRMLSSKDIVNKLKQIEAGVNINPIKNKAKSRKVHNKNRKNAKNKFKRKNSKEDADDLEKQAELVSEDSKADVESGNSPDQRISNRRKDRLRKEKKQHVKPDSSQKNTQLDDKPIINRSVKKRVDSFFLDNAVVVTDDDTSHGEFTAPVVEKETKTMQLKKKNRMGQRRRKILVEKEAGRKRQPNKGFQRTGKRDLHKWDNKRDNRSKEKVKFTSLSKKENSSNFNNSKKEDEHLHPSWQAKQKLKSYQSITAFSGTKITFDD